MLAVVAPLVVAVVPESLLLASDGWLAFAAFTESSLPGGGPGGLLLAGAALFWELLLLALLADARLAGGGGGAVSALFCVGGGGGSDALELPDVFWLTKPAKRSLAGGVLPRVSQAGAAWNAALAAAAVSWVALTTGRPPTKELTSQVSKDRAILSLKKYVVISIV